MKKAILALVLCLTHFVYAAPLLERSLDPQALAILGSTLGISEEGDFIEQTQKKWLRSQGTERWEMMELTQQQRLFVLEWAKEQGLFADWKPTSLSYDSALILGATTCRMQMRLDYLKQLWEEGVRFREIVWLTGERPLDDRIDRLTDRCTTESDAARAIWEESELPEQMRQLPVVFIAVPMHQEGNVYRRPNTEDTLIAWLETKPSARTCLFVSDQPFCGYQFAIVKSVLPDLFPFDLVGKGVDPSSHPAAAAITLDSIARWIYTEAISKATF